MVAIIALASATRACLIVVRLLHVVVDVRDRLGRRRAHRRRLLEAGALQRVLRARLRARHRRLAVVGRADRLLLPGARRAVDRQRRGRDGVVDLRHGLALRVVKVLDGHVGEAVDLRSEGGGKRGKGEEEGRHAVKMNEKYTVFNGGYSCQE